MDKKYILAAFTTILIFAVFMGLRHSKKTKEGNEYIETSNNQMVEMAQKSARGGLIQMGMVLKRYHKTNNKYPDSLKDLYPDYINNKPFLDEIDWQYTLKEDNFLLSKTTIIKNVKMVASIDKSMVPQTGSDIMMASINDIEGLITTRETEADTITAPDRIKKRRKTGIRAKEVKIVQTLRPEIVEVVEGEIGSGVAPDLSEMYLVWKDETGHLGFGNREYPIAQKLSTYSKGSWAHMHTRLQEKQGTVFDASTGNKNRNQIASEIGNNYLVWKDNSGNIGFGNVAYPDTNKFSVYDPEDKWVKAKKPLPEKNKLAEPETGTLQTKKTPDQLASGIGQKYLVWKDKSGNMGFGNVLLPKEGDLSVYNQNSWINARKPLKDEPTTDSPPPPTKKKSPDELASGLSEKYLVWKDKDGNIGFGDVLYPDAGNLFVYKQNKWIKAKKTISNSEKLTPTSSGINTLKKGKLSDKIGVKSSERYLVWKDKNGNICYGNIQYPEFNHISDIFVNGSWQKPKKK